MIAIQEFALPTVLNHPPLAGGSKNKAPQETDFSGRGRFLLCC
jgi:hypothetical protein